MSSSQRELRGVLPVFQTPYYPDETIDHVTLEREITWLYECGAHGIAHADRIHSPLAALISMQTSLDAFLAVEKHLLVRQGIFKNTLVRGPVGFRLDAETTREVDRLFDRMIEAAK